MNRMTSKEKLLIFIREFHKGSENPVSNKELQRVFRLKEDEVRSCIRRLRIQGHPICCSESGYFYAQNREDILKTVLLLKKMRSGIEQSETALLAAMMEDPKERKGEK